MNDKDACGQKAVSRGGEAQKPQTRNARAKQKAKKTAITEKDTTKNQATNKRTAKTRGDYKSRLLSAPPGEQILAENYPFIPRGD